jgi:hypothetical protein
MLNHALGKNHAAVNWEVARSTLAAAKGMPTLIGVAVKPESVTATTVRPTAQRAH